MFQCITGGYANITAQWWRNVSAIHTCRLAVDWETVNFAQHGRFTTKHGIEYFNPSCEENRHIQLSYMVVWRHHTSHRYCKTLKADWALLFKILTNQRSFTTISIMSYPARRNLESILYNLYRSLNWWSLHN